MRCETTTPAEARTMELGKELRQIHVRAHTAHTAHAVLIVFAHVVPLPFLRVREYAVGLGDEFELLFVSPLRMKRKVTSATNYNYAG